MSDGAVIVFECTSCGKSYRVAEAMAGRLAKCKKCGERMRVPKPESTAPDDDGFIPLVDDDDERPHTAPGQSAASTGRHQPSASDEVAADDDSLSTSDVFQLADLEALAVSEGDADLEPSVFATQAAYVAPQAAPHNKVAAIGGGLMNNLAAMWEALVTPSRANGHIPLTRRISMGGAFLLVNSTLLMFFALVQASPVKIQQVRDVLNNANGPNQWMQRASNTAPTILVPIAGLILGFLVLAWRYWAPRKDDEAKLIPIVFWGMLTLALGSTLIAFFGGIDLALILAQAGAFGVLLAAAAFGAWVYLRLASDGDGSMSFLLVGPAVIMPVTLLILIAANVPSEAIDQLPWDRIFLTAFLMFVVLMLMGGAIAFMVLIALPLHLIGIIERPPSPIDLPGGSGGMGMIVIGGGCLLCYLMLVIARWRIMLKPVAWQFVVLVFGASLMAGVEGFSYTAQVGRVDRQIAQENERLTRILREAGRIGPVVTASHEPFPNISELLRGPDRDEVVYLSNGDRIHQDGGIHEGWVDPDSTNLPTFKPGRDRWPQVADTNDPWASPELAPFDPALGRTDPGPIRYIQPGVDIPPVMADGESRPVNPEGARQPGKLASWTPFPHSAKTRGRGVRFLYLASGGIIVNPPDEMLMMYGMERDTRPKPVLPMVPQFDPQYLPVGAAPLRESIRSSDNREGDPVGRDAWPAFIQPPTVKLDGASPFAFGGYEMDILAGYEIKGMRYDRKTGIRTLVIARKNHEGLEHPPLELYLAPHREISNGIPERRNWDRKVRIFDPVMLARSYEFGLIDGHQFTRIPPDAWHLQGQDTRYYYVSQMLDGLYWIGMSISSAMQSPAGILECEAMARSLRRLPASMASPMPEEIPPGTTARSDAETIAATAWHVNGVFAFPKEISKTLRASVDYENTKFLSLNWDNDGSGIFIDMYPRKSADEAGIRVQKDGPVLIGPRASAGEEGFTGKTVGAYGQDVRYERLWNDEPFVRVDHGPILFVRGERYAETAYYGWLGEYWVEVRLRRREGSVATLEEFEAMLREMRLAYPIEVSKGRDFEKWAVEFEKSSRLRQSLPLAGGLTFGDAFDRDRDQKIIFDKDIDPYGGLDPAVFAGTIHRPKEGPVAVTPVDPDPEPEPELPPGLEPVEGFEQWTVDDAAEQHLGSTQSFGRFKFKPLKDLRASAKNRDQYAEWFARTNSGKVGLTLKYEKLLPDQELIKVPLMIDPATGEVTLQLGRRVLKPSGVPQMKYHDTGGLRIWRILMPQAGGAPVRRCYYVIAVKDGHLVIAADFERDKAEQLQAMDASVASLVDHRPAPIE